LNEIYVIGRTSKSPLIMKNKAAAILLFFALAVLAYSCAPSSKYGCPMNPQASYRYRG